MTQGDLDESCKPRPFKAIVLALILVVAISGAVIAAPSIGLTRAPVAPIPTGSASPSIGLRVPPLSRVLIIGDSYAEGVGASSPTKRWTTLLSNAEGWDTTLNAVGGTGFTWGGGTDGTAGKDYATRIATLSRAQDYRPDLVLLEGGQNDIRASDGQLARAVAVTVHMAKAVWPSAQVIVLGPAAPEPYSTQIGRLNADVERGALLAGARSINPRTTSWFTNENSSRLTYQGLHVNDGGHALIADKVAQAMKHFARTDDRSF